MRLLLYELRLEGQQAMHLPEALRLRLDAVEARAGVRVETAIDPHLVQPPPVEADLYWIAMEALNNALKHAAATMVSVSLDRCGDVIRLEIEDDGVGMSPHLLLARARDGAVDGGLSGGLGLRSMRERAARLGGTLAIARGKRGGVAVRLEVLAADATGAPDGLAPEGAQDLVGWAFASAHVEEHS
jgi:signal transduction histidine kinase